MGYHPEIILAGRRMNDSMGKYIATEVIKLMMRKNIKIIASRVLILGFTFKENCPDIRNSKVIDIYDELKSFDINVDVFDPWADAKEVLEHYGISILSKEKEIIIEKYSAIILAVSHSEFNFLNLSKSQNLVIFDVKGILGKDKVDARL